ncbi:hypothetical protein IFT48_02335 [Pseudomonas fluorescens]|uniref:hypothetical protein n=1 Tax=Pseudomonas fluorescens TaxID=294 RepID=UPI001930C3C9|nr:hypothetical protein [Pseudomonas fluorescens]MBD8088802.1 hypothetical protein [Pseudomonas fluorescens]
MISLAKPGQNRSIRAVIVFAVTLCTLSLAAVASVTHLAFLSAWCSLAIWIVITTIFSRAMKQATGNPKPALSFLFGALMWLVFMLGAFHVTPDMGKPSTFESFVFLFLGFAIPLLAARLSGVVVKRLVWSGFDAGWPREPLTAQ